MKAFTGALLLVGFAAGSCNSSDGKTQSRPVHARGGDGESGTTEIIPTDEPDVPLAALVGTWRLVLESRGGPVPVTMQIFEDGHEPPVVFRNGAERAPGSTLEIRGATVTIRVAPFDSVLTARVDESHAVMVGRWRKVIPGGETRLDLHATKGVTHRFEPEPPDPDARSKAPANVSGSWAVQFDGDLGKYPGVGEFQQEGSRVTGTFLTPEGDFRFLEGDYAAGRLRMSAFDGAHAALFVARVEPDGTIVGDVWEGDGIHAKWTGKRSGDDAVREVLPDPYEEVRVLNPEGKLRFQFPNLVGKPVSLSSRRFRGKVVIVEIFGTWCPNCNDAAPLLADWYRRYRDRGLEIIGLAFEHTGDSRRDREVLRAYKERYGIEYSLLVAGTSDKKSASSALSDLSELKAYPTTVFIDRAGRVRKIHSGFAGPGTGEHHTRLVAEFEQTIEALLAEGRSGRSR